MKAYKVNENINFKRGRDPHAVLNIGKIQELEKLLDTEFKDSADIMEYKIHDINNIEIYEINRQVARAPYFLEYVPLIQFKIHNKIVDGSYIIIRQELNNYAAKWNKTKIVENWHLKVPIHNKNDEEAETQANIIIDAFNKHYPPKWGLQVKE